MRIFVVWLQRLGAILHILRPVHTAGMNGSSEFLAVYVPWGLGKAGGNQYSFLERGGAQSESGAVLGAGNVTVQKPASAFEALTDQHR